MPAFDQAFANVYTAISNGLLGNRRANADDEERPGRIKNLQAVIDELTAQTASIKQATEESKVDFETRSEFMKQLIGDLGGWHKKIVDASKEPGGKAAVDAILAKQGFPPGTKDTAAFDALPAALQGLRMTGIPFSSTSMYSGGSPEYGPDRPAKMGPQDPIEKYAADTQAQKAAEALTAATSEKIYRNYAMSTIKDGANLLSGFAAKLANDYGLKSLDDLPGLPTDVLGKLQAEARLHSATLYNPSAMTGQMPDTMRYNMRGGLLGRPQTHYPYSPPQTPQSFDEAINMLLQDQTNF